MISIKRTIIFLLSLLPATLLMAATGKLFTADRELSSSMASHLMQDRSGNIWISTENGLNRYDAAKFRVYHHDTGDSTSLTSSFVNLTFQTSGGDILVGTMKGLCRYNPAGDNFERITLLDANGHPLPSIDVVGFAELPNHEVVAATAGTGLHRLQISPQGIKCRRMAVKEIPEKFIFGLFADAQGRLWVGGQEGRIYRMTNGQVRQMSINLMSGGAIHNISCFCQDNQGRIFVGTQGGGLWRYEAATESFSPVMSPSLSDADISCMLSTPEGRILIGTDGRGQWEFDPATNQFQQPRLYAGRQSLDQEKVFSILLDTAGNTWEAIHHRGVAVFPSFLYPFQYIGHRSAENNLIGSKPVTSVCYDSRQQLWVATEGDALYCLSPSGAVARLTEKDGVPLNRVNTLYEDRNHHLWIGTKGHGLLGHPIADPAGHAVETISCIMETDDGHLFVGTSGKGLYDIYLPTGETRCWNNPGEGGLQQQSAPLSNLWVNCIVQQGERLYIGTYFGLNCLNLRTRTMDPDINSNAELSREIVHSIVSTPDGRLWLATHNGLIRLKDNQIERRYTTRDGLPSDLIFSMQTDSRGHLWLGTGHGLSEMAPEGHFENYYSGDGLQGNEFSAGVACAVGQELAFGGLGGLTRFRPSDIKARSGQPLIRITDFYLNGRPITSVSHSGRHSVTDGLVPQQATTFNLDYDNNTFTVEFATDEYYSPERIRYGYTLDEGPFTLLPPGANSITLSNLPPDTYQLQVVAIDLDRRSEPLCLSIKVHPAWWASWWAKLIYTLLAIAAVLLTILYMQFRYRQREKERERQHKEQEQEARLQFLMNISHELRTPMSMIISPARQLLDHDEDPQRKHQYEVILRSAQRIMRLVNQMLDVRKIEKGQLHLQLQPMRLSPVLEELCKNMEYAARQKNIQLNFHSECPDAWAMTDPANFDKILLNLLSNAIKYTPEGGHIDVVLTKEEAEQMLQLTVTDTGMGISDKDKQHIFDRFYQVPGHVNAAQPGTGIGLNLAYSLSEMHGGKLSVGDNPDGQGSRFTLQLPTCQPAPSTTTAKPSAKQNSTGRDYLLLVDDDAEIREYVSQELADTYHVQTASNGREAWSMLLSANRRPDVIVTDLMMPEMDGIELCRKIKQNIQVNTIPVVMLTAMTDEETHLRSLNIGADGYVTKPFSLPLLRQTLSNVLRSRNMLQNFFEGRQQQSDEINIEEMKHEPSADEKLMARILKVVERHISDPKLNVEFIAQEAGVSRVHLYRKLKELTNQSPGDFVRHIRLEKAAELLKQRNYNVSEIAERMGFTSLSVFSRAFKDFYGLSPKEYMDQKGEE